MQEVIIGKHTLESLTTGMYSDPFVVYREYIQNAADSLDEAVAKQLIAEDEKRIVIDISPIEKSVVIEDNGAGIKEEMVVKTLLSIGSSNKINQNSRGFRGIGRLSGLSYCSKISFETTAIGDDKLTILSFDAKKMTEILSSDCGSDMTALDVLESVYQINTKDVDSLAHFFRVTMSDIDSASSLLDIDAIRDYISQTAPVPYSPSFTWGREICDRMEKNGYRLPSYNIILREDTKDTPIYKPYSDDFFVDKRKLIPDNIQNIGMIQVRSGKDKLLAIGWLAQTGFKGSIYDKKIRGIRMRKGNILIGDGQTLNTIFKDQRFNGWSIGEVFAISSRLIPNARRDDFEKNDDYYVFFEALEGIADRITKTIRNISAQRNTNNSKAINRQANNSYTGSSEQNGHRGVGDVVTAAAKEKEGTSQISFDELDMLIGQVKGVTSYKAINALKTIPNKEKQILERVFNAIIATADEHADDMIEAIIQEFSV